MDEVLRRATDAAEVPGVVAMAADKDGIFYQGAYGKRKLGNGAAMTVDTVFRIMSMTKAIASAAAMRLVEQGKVALDQPVASIVPAFGELQVLEGFDGERPKLRAPRRRATVRHLLTHTAGFGYEIWSAETGRYQAAAGVPSIISCERAALRYPLLFDPGERWEYGVNIDWLGQVVEAASGQTLAAYCQDHIFAPLGMKDTAFGADAARRSRLAGCHVRGPDGSLTPIEFDLPQEPEVHCGGHGLYSTATDYMQFLLMLLKGGEHGGARVLEPETVELMEQNHIGALDVTVMTTVDPTLSNDAEFFPGMPKKHGLGFMINLEQAPGMRAANSYCWAGLLNTYFWFDPTSAIAGVILMQILPFVDHEAIDLYTDFEKAVYASR